MPFSFFILKLLKNIFAENNRFCWKSENDANSRGRRNNVLCVFMTQCVRKSLFNSPLTNTLRVLWKHQVTTKKIMGRSEKGLSSHFTKNEVLQFSENKDFFSKCDQTKSAGNCGFETLTEETLNGKLHFLRRVRGFLNTSQSLDLTVIHK